jgi:membrane protease YdiL (CAAX protease family)
LRSAESGPVRYKLVMSHVEAAPASETLPGIPTGKSAGEKRLRWFEVSLVLLISFGNSLFNSLYILSHGPNAAPRMSNARVLLGMLSEATSLALLGYVLWRRGRRFSDIGLRWSFRDLGVGAIVLVVSYLLYAAGSYALFFVHYWLVGTRIMGPSAKQIFGHPSIAFLPFSLLNGFFEELIVRAYLMTEVFELTGSKALAVLLSVLVQFSYHLYYGWWRAIAISFLFVAYSLYFARWRRALPIIFAHECFDLWALIRLW